ncbi:MAG: MFS transporter [Lachnospiraceae bacterium]|nr:MFS transporter [Lachnospiraceae bacterium]
MSEGAKLVYAYFTYIFMAVIVYTIYGIANTALLPLMSRDHGETTMLATFSAVGNNLIGLIAGASITPLVLNLGWQKNSLPTVNLFASRDVLHFILMSIT